MASKAKASVSPNPKATGPLPETKGTSSSSPNLTSKGLPEGKGSSTPTPQSTAKSTSQSTPTSKKSETKLVANKYMQLTPDQQVDELYRTSDSLDQAVSKGGEALAKASQNFFHLGSF